MKILIINGPNLNMLGIREPSIYGDKNYQDLEKYILKTCSKIGFNNVEVYQSNSEGAIIDKIHEAYFNKIAYIIINPGALTHYSYSLRDAISSVGIKTVEVHLSDITKREEFRKKSVLEGIVDNRFYGNGFYSYKDALEYLKNKN